MIYSYMYMQVRKKVDVKVGQYLVMQAFSNMLRLLGLRFGLVSTELII